jgi:hypothetical protein
MNSWFNWLLNFFANTHDQKFYYFQNFDIAMIDGSLIF